MKSLKFISAIALTLMMASCEDFDLPNPPGQTNPEPEKVFENSGIQLAQGDATLNLVDYNNNNKDVNVANVTELVNFPADYTLSVDMEISGDALFTNATTISTTLEGDAVMVNPDILNGAIQTAISKKPGLYDIYARYIAYANRDNTRVRLGGLDAYFAAGSVYHVTTLDPAKVLEDAYYFVPVDANGNLQYGKALKMNNTLGNVNVYDNPEFAVKINVEEAEAITEKGYTWKIAPQSAVTAQNTVGVLGCNPSENDPLSGKLGDAYDAGAIHIFGPLLVTINVEIDSYTVSYAFENLWPLSGTTQNKPGDALMLYTTNYIEYTGVSVLNKVWILAAQPDKNGPVIFKQDPDIEAEVSEDMLSQTGVLTALSTGTSLRTPGNTNGLFWIKANVVQSLYELHYLKTLSVIGTANDWNLETAVELTPSKDFKTWTAENVHVNGDFKINANGAWTIGFSGTQVQDTMNELVYNVDKQDGGDNLVAPEGHYDITLDFSAKPYVVTLKKK
ncbi:MAG: hypothetical protein HDS12_05700 [Bacteroides sp.]|nr:hypothetical protein [Bacteroides sp.]